MLYYWHSVGNRLLTTISNMVTDLESHRHGNLLQGFPPGGHPIDPARRGSVRVRARDHDQDRPQARDSHLRDADSYHGRRYDQGKKIGAKDGFRALYCLAKYGLFR